MESANRGLIIRTGSMSQRSARLLSVASDRPTVPSRVIALSQADICSFRGLAVQPSWPARNALSAAQPPRRSLTMDDVAPLDVRLQRLPDTRNKLRELNQRWNNRLVLEGLSFPEAYLDGRF